MLTQELLKELIHYDPETGEFTWLERDRRHFKTDRSRNIWNTTFHGNVAGGDDGSGYLRIGVLCKSYRAHRLAFLYMTGEFPPEHTDHINGIRDDNRWINLRAATSAENCRNARISSNNNSGVHGVSWHKRCSFWVVGIQLNGKSKHIGYFKDKFEAICARKSAEREYGYHINHGRKF